MISLSLRTAPYDIKRILAHHDCTSRETKQRVHATARSSAAISNTSRFTSYGSATGSIAPSPTERVVVGEGTHCCVVMNCTYINRADVNFGSAAWSTDVPISISLPIAGKAFRRPYQTVKHDLSVWMHENRMPEQKVSARRLRCSSENE
jgi:hypothetical protein